VSDPAPSPLCALTHLEALAALQAAEAKIADLRRRVQTSARHRARSLRRALDAPILAFPPLYFPIMDEISRLMMIPESSMTPAEEALLDTLVDVAMVYEQISLPGWLFPEASGEPPQQ
jgi:hypothetical protein